MKPLRIALSKGRIFDETLPLFAAAGIRPSEDPGRSRKLIIRSEPAEGAAADPAGVPPVDFLIVRASDVPTYVQHGGADLGVVGKDVLMEHGGEGLLEPLDLGIARCRLMVAGHPGTVLDGIVGSRTVSGGGQRLRVATKYAECARRHFAAHHRQVEIIKLYGSMELAPLVGLADLIVDVVDTGSTLRANHLEPLEHIADISSRLVVNRASMKTRHREVDTLVRRLREAVARASGDADAPDPSASGTREPTPTTSAASATP